ncbi:MAG: HEAT repeat domain-containing protein [Spirochaetales bacterium]|nr:HEAT repeat domain-containing protein [Spirochaetales bacterium]
MTLIWKINDVKRGLRLSLEETRDGNEIYTANINSFSCTVQFEKNIFEQYFGHLTMSMSKLSGKIFNTCLCVKKRQVPEKIGRVFADPVTTGDPDFDILAEVTKNNRILMAAYLNAGLRNIIVKLFRKCHTIFISPHYISFTISFMSFLNWNDLNSCIIKPSFEAAGELGRAIDIRESLLENLKNDPVPSIRIRCIKALLNDYINEIDKPDLLKRCPADPALEVAGFAYNELGARRRKALEEIVKKQIEEGFLTDEKEVCLYAFIGTTGDSRFLHVLQEAFLKTKSVSAKEAIIKAIGSLGQRDVSPFLAVLLDEPEQDIRLAVISALASCGGRDAIPKLANMIGLTENDTLKKAALQTLKILTERFGRTESGLLSIHTDTPPAGGLSITESSVPGSLSVSDGNVEDEQP